MSKQPSTGIKKILAVLLAAFFVVSLSAVSVDARGGGGHGGWGHGGRHWIVYLKNNWK